MKPLSVIPIILMSLFISLLSAQIGYVRNVDIISPNENFYIGTYTPKAIFPCSDNGIIVIGQVKVMRNDDMYWVGDIVVVKVDSMGNSIWQRFVGHWGGFDIPNATGIDMDANGIVHFMSDDDANLEFYAIDQSGTITTIGTQHVTYLNHVNRAMRLNNGEIACVGFGWTNVPWTQNLVIGAAYLRITESGDTLAFKHYAPDSLTIGNPDAKAFDMELDTDGLPLITCRFTDYKASVIKVDLGGIIIFRIDIDLTIGYPITISKIPNNNYCLIAINHWLGLENGYQRMIYKLQGSSLNNLFSFVAQSNAHICRILDTSNGILINSRVNGQNFIALYDIMGHTQWDSLFVQFLGGIDDEEPPELMQTTSDNCVVNVVDYGNAGFKIIKLLPNGTITGIHDDIAPVESVGTLAVYPNPVIKNTHIKLINNQPINKGGITASIYNVRGQQVRKIKLNSKDANLLEADWDGTNDNGVRCASGVYIIRTNNGQNNISKKIIVIH